MTSYVTSKESITLECALEVTQTALAKARQINREVAIVVLDSAATPLLDLRMDHAPIPCQNIARHKANTALAFAISTNRWDDRFPNLSPGARKGLPLQDGLAFFGGGEPLMRNGRPIGSIGVSGASEAEDGIIAGAAVEAYEKLTGYS